jgi:hypothetical protein
MYTMYTFFGMLQLPSSDVFLSKRFSSFGRLVSSAKHQAVDSAVPSGLPPRRRLIRHQPVQAEMPHRIDKLIEVDRFADKTVGAKVVTRVDICFFFTGCQDHNRQSPGPLVSAHSSQNAQTIDFGQFHVEQYDFRHDLGVSTGVAARREKIVDGFLSSNITIAKAISPAARRTCCCLGRLADTTTSSWAETKLKSAFLKVLRSNT